MVARKIRSHLIPIATVVSILSVSLAVIAYGRGYRIDVSQSGIKPTGLISATSDPIGAQVYVNGQLKTATNNSINIDPGWYPVTISKEGYMSWQKHLRVQGEVVSRADAFLFPTNPSLSPLTTLGIQKPTLSPDGSKIAYIIGSEHLDNGLAKKAGLWVYTLSDTALGMNRDPLQIAAVDASFDLEGSTLQWSPDSTQIMATTPVATRLYSTNRTGVFTDVTSVRATRLAEWAEEEAIKELQKLEAFKQPIIDLASSSARILSFSPDETKILYEATAAATIPNIINPPLIGTNPTKEDRDIVPGNIYVYDAKDDKNFLLLAAKEIPPTPTPTPTPRGTRKIPVATPAESRPPMHQAIHWFPTSRHIMLMLPGKIDIMEYDRTNWVTVYAGPFEESFMAPWSDGSRIVVLTNLNPGVSSLPNLYTVNLR